MLGNERFADCDLQLIAKVEANDAVGGISLVAQALPHF